MIRRALLVIAFVWLSGCTSTSSFTGKDIFATVEGRWVFHEYHPLGCENRWVQIDFFEDRSRARFSIGKQLRLVDNPGTNAYFYKVLDSSSNSVTLFLENEDRKDPSGELIIWVLEMDSDNVFVWKMTHWPDNIDNRSLAVWPYRRIRCDGT